MSTTTTQQHIAFVGTVFLPVSDQDASLAFYRDQLGMEVRSDTTYGEGNRWVEVAPKGAQTVIALNGPSDHGEGVSPGGNAPFGLDTDDLDTAVAELSAKGVEFDEIMRMGDPVPPMAWFTDPDGNRLLLVQRAD